MPCSANRRRTTVQAFQRRTFSSRARTFSVRTFPMQTARKFPPRGRLLPYLVFGRLGIGNSRGLDDASRACEGLSEPTCWARFKSPSKNGKSFKADCKRRKTPFSEQSIHVSAENAILFGQRLSWQCDGSYALAGPVDSLLRITWHRSVLVR